MYLTVEQETIRVSQSVAGKVVWSKGTHSVANVDRLVWRLSHCSLLFCSAGVVLV